MNTLLDKGTNASQTRRRGDVENTESGQQPVCPSSACATVPKPSDRSGQEEWGSGDWGLGTACWDLEGIKCQSPGPMWFSTLLSPQITWGALRPAWKP